MGAQIIAFIMLVVISIIFFIKGTKWVGLSIILFTIVTTVFSIVCYIDVSNAKKEARTGGYASIQIEDISFEAGTNYKGEDGYCFTLTVANRAGCVQTEELYCSTDKNTRVKMEPVSIFETIDSDSNWYPEIMENREIPPATEVKIMFFVTKDTLSKVKGDTLVFKDAGSKSKITVSMNELK